MKRLTLLLLALVAILLPAAAQHKGKDKEAMRKEVLEFKLKYLAQEMDLREDQQQPFVDTYKQMAEEKAKVFRETSAMSKKLKDADNVSDAEYEAVTKAVNESKEKYLAIDKKYDEKFAKFLTPKQIYKMRSAEEQFNKKMHEMRQNKKKQK